MYILIFSDKHGIDEIVQKAMDDIGKLGLKPEMDFGCYIDHLANPSPAHFVYCPVEGND